MLCDAIFIYQSTTQCTPLVHSDGQWTIRVLGGRLANGKRWYLKTSLPEHTPSVTCSHHPPTTAPPHLQFCLTGTSRSRSKADL